MCIRCHLLSVPWFCDIRLFIEQLYEGRLFVLDLKDHAAVIDISPLSRVRSGHTDFNSAFFTIRV